MKKGLTLLIGLTIFCCSPSNDSLESYQEALPIESADLPDEIRVNEDYEIALSYLRPTTCHAFNDILLQKNDNQGTVYVIGTVFQSNGNCTELNTELEASFSFKATQIGSYIFKFWQGQDDNGEDIYLSIEVSVIE